MPGTDDRDDTRPREQTPGADGLVDSDDTTQADLGMVGGAGAAEDEATVAPQAAEPLDEATDEEDR